MWRVVAFTDQPIWELGLIALLQPDSEFDLVQVCRSRADFVDAAHEHQPDLLLYSLDLDSELGVALELRRVAPYAALVMVGRDVPAELAQRAILAGVRGFVSPSALPGTFKDFLRATMAGELAAAELAIEGSRTLRALNNQPIRLSRRQSQLVGLLVQGRANKEIATALGISEGTVKTHLAKLFEKVGAKDRFELALFGLKNLRSLQAMGETIRARGAAAGSTPQGLAAQDSSKHRR